MWRSGEVEKEVGDALCGGTFLPRFQRVATLLIGQNCVKG